VGQKVSRQFLSISSPNIDRFFKYYKFSRNVPVKKFFENRSIYFGEECKDMAEICDLLFLAHPVGST